MSILQHFKPIALGLAFAGAGVLSLPAHADDDACAGVDTVLTDERTQEYAVLIADSISQDLEPSERFQATDVEIYDFLESGTWSAVYGAVPTADIGMFFFEEEDGRKQFRDVWGGMAEPSERPDLIDWARDLGAPENLATCFAHYIIDGTPADQSFGFSVDLGFTQAALDTLTRQGEEVIVSASYYADPTPEGKEHANEIGQIDLGSEDVQVPAAPGRVEITGSDVDTDSLQWTQGDVMVNVNVYSARLSSDDNLLSCDFIDGPLSAVSNSPVTLRCALIEENFDTELKP